MSVRVESRTLTKIARVGVHSHIRNLESVIGQEKPRKAAAVIVRMVKANKLAGRVILLTGQPGTGKTAIALAIARELGSADKIPFVHMTGSEVFSVDVSKTEVLTQGLRRAIGVSVKETVEIISGEVTEFVIDNNTSAPDDRKGSLTLRTTQMESVYNLGPKMIASLERQRITAGDVISLNKGSGRITRVGRSFMRSSEYDAVNAGVAYVEVPDGELQKQEELVHTVSLHEIDVINSRTQGFLALFAGDTGEIKTEVRNQVDQKVADWREENQAQVTAGILFIDECHLLDLECYSFLNRILEHETAPLLILATNRGGHTGDEMVDGAPEEGSSPHGIPVDFLDRLLTISTESYNDEQKQAIIAKRLLAEDIAFEDGDACVAYLVSVANSASLRYALHLASIANVAAAKRKATQVNLEDLKRCYKLFIDVGRLQGREASPEPVRSEG